MGAKDSHMMEYDQFESGYPNVQDGMLVDNSNCPWSEPRIANNYVVTKTQLFHPQFEPGGAGRPKIRKSPQNLAPEFALFPAHDDVAGWRLWMRQFSWNW